MRLTEVILVKYSLELSKIRHLAKNLYNLANWYVRQDFFNLNNLANWYVRQDFFNLNNLLRFLEACLKLPKEFYSMPM